jgi:transcription-repair coupling factor (superfamily II helicase)
LKSNSINKDNALQREKVCESIEGDNNRIYVSYANGIAEKVSKQNSNNENTIEIKCEEEYYFSEINEKLFKIDYQKCDFVQSPGDFALRGRILDVFTFSNENPIRIQFDDNNVESIREFDVNTQFSIKELKEIKIKPSPTSDITVKDDCLLNLFNNEALIITKSLKTIKDLIDNFHKFDSSNYIGLDEFNSIITNKDYLINICENHSDVDIKFNKIPQPSFNKNFDLLNKNLLKYFSDGYKINIYFNSVEQSLIGFIVLNFKNDFQNLKK